MTIDVALIVLVLTAFGGLFVLFGKYIINTIDTKLSEFKKIADEHEKKLIALKEQQIKCGATKDKANNDTITEMENELESTKKEMSALIATIQSMDVKIDRIEKAMMKLQNLHTQKDADVKELRSKISALQKKYDDLLKEKDQNVVRKKIKSIRS